MNCVCAADDQAELHHTVFLSAHRSCCWMCMQLQTTHRYHMLDLLYRKKNRNDHSELFCVWWSWLKWRHGEAGGIFCTSSTKFVGVICIISTFDADSTCVWSDCQVGRDDRKVMKHRKYICWFVGEHFDEIIDQQWILHLIKSRLFTIRQNLVEEKCGLFTSKLN